MAIRTRPVEVCPVCRGSGRVRYEQLSDRAFGVNGFWDMLECMFCGSAWLQRVPVPEDLGQCYVGAYYTHQTPEPVTLGSTPRASMLRRLVLSARKGYKHLAPRKAFSNAIGSVLGFYPPVAARACFGNSDLFPKFKPGGRVLEIGCGDGRFLSAMKLLGWDVRGIEPDPIASDIARRAVGCEIHTGTLDDNPFKPGQFDVIVSSHVIEHVYDPQSFVAGASRLLAKDGTMSVITPNFASLGRRVFGSDWYCLDPPRHLCLFTPRSLRRLFEDGGRFSDVQTRTITRASSLAMHRRKAVKRTGNFLGDIRPSRMTQLMFSALESAGNPIFSCGEEIFCSAVRK